MKPFFVHVSRPVTKRDNSRLRHIPRGFTAYVEADERDPRTCKVRTAICSASEPEFNKRVGRVVALDQEPVVLNKRSLPSYIGQYEAYINNDNVASIPYYEEKRMYLLKYVV
jgi:hypothetical protein